MSQAGLKRVKGNCLNVKGKALQVWKSDPVIKINILQVWKSDPNRFTSRVTLTLSPVDDPDIHTVYCMASQGGPNGAFEVSRKINVFPAERENNWELYQRIKDLQVA